MPAFSSFDTRGYPTVSPREGYGLWSLSYEETVKEDMDLWLLEQVKTVEWADVHRTADLGCGTGRTGAWESARIATAGAAHVVVGFHPFFIMKVGMPTHFDGPDGSPIAIETHVHLFSEHVQAALAAGWSLAEMHEQVIDQRWIVKKPKWAAHQDMPVSFLAVWRRAKDETGGRARSERPALSNHSRP